MGSGKTSLVQRFVRGQYFENPVGGEGGAGGGAARRGTRARATHPPRPLAAVTRAVTPLLPQESTIGASFFTKTLPEKHVKFEIW